MVTCFSQREAPRELTFRHTHTPQQHTEQSHLSEKEIVCIDARIAVGAESLQQEKVVHRCIDQGRDQQDHRNQAEDKSWAWMLLPAGRAQPPEEAAGGYRVRGKRVVDGQETGLRSHEIVYRNTDRRYDRNEEEEAAIPGCQERAFD